ncbi:MAG: type II methionyl aminopeptidase [archaeon]|nr:MAG: type II methionyl aminopeptidase [archaeon]
MDPDVLDKYKKAGRICRDCLEFGNSMINPGVKIIEVVEQIEDKITKSGAGFAFPINVSLNETAAHDTADIGDMRAFQDGDLVKLDIGVQVDGYIADSALTISLNSGKEELYKTAQKALGRALKLMRPGTPVPVVSQTIEETIRNAGFNPIINLTGHGLDRYRLHSRIEFPNVRTDVNYVLKEGDVFALEPFVTDGSGKVTETEKVLIYMFISDRPTRFPESRKILEMASDMFHGLPFTKRWINQRLKISPLKLNLVLRQLEQNNSLYAYPALREIKNGSVAQAEHTVIVGDKPRITTA